MNTLECRALVQRYDRKAPGQSGEAANFLRSVKSYAASTVASSGMPTVCYPMNTLEMRLILAETTGGDQDASSVIGGEFKSERWAQNSSRIR